MIEINEQEFLMFEDAIWASEQLSDEILLEQYRLDQELLLYPNYEALERMNEYIDFLEGYVRHKYS